MGEKMKKPNILFILCDQFRGDSMGCAGAPIRTPNLDSLAAEGVRFTNCCTVAPLCVPARISLFTGKYPHTTTAWDNALYVMNPEGNIWLKEIRQAGYATSLVGKTHLHADRGNLIEREELLHRYGFDDVNETSGPHATAQTTTHYRHMLEEKGLFDAYREDMLSRGKRPFARPSPLPVEDYYDTYVGEKGLEWLQNYSGDKPWFCHVSFGGPHEPWDAPEPYASMYRPEDMPAPLPEITDRNPNRPRGEYDRVFNKLRMDNQLSQSREIRANYYGNITLIDEEIGKLLNAVRARGEWDNTVVVFSSDHGEMNGDHGFVNKRNFFTGALNVPLIVRTPETAKEGGRVSDAFVSLLDVGATLADYADAPLSYEQYGISVAPIVRGEKESIRPWVLSEYAGERMLLTDEWKMVVNRLGQPYLLFHRPDDPDERDNLAGTAEAAATERELLAELLQITCETTPVKPANTQLPWSFEKDSEAEKNCPD